MGGYSLTIGLNALNHLGVNLYNSVPAVLSEAVANAWDADAHNVTIDTGSDEITIKDDGHGMTKDDCNTKFLTVGYDRRKKGRGLTPCNRKVIGRKGIGKLSLFSIADVIEIHTVKDGDPNQKSGFIMDIQKIRSDIEKDNSSAARCELEEVASEKIDIERGTVIKLTKLNKRTGQDAKAVRKNLARRFSIIDPSREFRVVVNGDPITVKDRDYLTKLEYVWYMGGEGKRITRVCEHKEEIDGTVDPEKEYRVSGWVGTVRKQEDIDDGNNQISVMARGKIVHEDILGNIKEGGIFSKYLVGEIQADFLDMDDEPDIATSSRQSVIEDSDRFIALKEYVQKSVIKKIQSQWTDLRTAKARDDALRDPAVKRWFGRLTSGNKKYAERLFRKIETFKGLEMDAKIELYRSSILAFETLSMHDRLAELDRLPESDGLEPLLKLLGDVDNLEASHYLEITRSRLKVLEKFTNLVDKNVKEKVMQQYLFDHLWLLDPAWERAGEDKRMEEQFRTACKGANAKLTREEELARVDIRYRTHAGMHIIVELKKSGVSQNIDELTGQIRKYNDAMEKLLEARGTSNPQIDIVCVLGSEPVPGTDAKKKQEQLKIHNGRYVTYEYLIRGAMRAYGEYLNKWKDIKSIKDLVEAIEFAPPPETPTADSG